MMLLLFFFPPAKTAIGWLAGWVGAGIMPRLSFARVDLGGDGGGTSSL
jgi:hypothetical protein